MLLSFSEIRYLIPSIPSKIRNFTTIVQNLRRLDKLTP